MPKNNERRMDVTVGEYHYIQYMDGGSEVLRNGNGWRDVTGDKLILAMATEIENLREKLRETYQD